jgi:hypothetical protein
LNTDLSSGPGEHWCVAFFPDKQTCEYFDPFGMSPKVEKSHNFFPLLCQNGANQILYSTKQVQSIHEGTCGQHCVYFACLRSQGISMSEIVNNYYSDNLALNDKKVVDFVKHQRMIYNV